MSHEVSSGVDVRTFKQIKIRMLTTGEFDPNVWNELSDFQKFWVNETKKTYRDLSMS